MDESLSQTLWQLLLVALLIAANGFFVASEFALVAVRRTRVEQLVSEGNRAARAVKQALGDLDRYIAAAQLGITMASLGLGWVAEPALAHLMEPLFGWLPGALPQLSSHVAAVAIAFTLITLLHIILGEQVPKMVALQRAETTALLIAGPLALFLWLFGPFIRLLSWSTNALIRAVGLQPTTAHETAHSEEELQMLVTASQESGILQASEEEMLQKVFTFADKEAHQVMVPRTEIVAVPVEMKLRDFLTFTADEHLHTRFPVYEGTLDSIVGIIHLKDAIIAPATDRLDEEIRAVMRPVLVVPETIHIDELLRQLRTRRMHMAVLVDEYGGTAGLATMEDLLEEIVGEIRDEFDEEEPGLADHHDGTWSVDGMMSIGEFNQRFGQDIQDENYDTIAGYVLGQLGRVADIGDEVSVDGLVLRVEELDGLRIAALRVMPAPGTTLVVEQDDYLADEPIEVETPANHQSPASASRQTSG
jgi:CBS domain containing-hemolysin-like protein